MKINLNYGKAYHFMDFEGRFVRIREGYNQSIY